MGKEEEAKLRKDRHEQICQSRISADQAKGIMTEIGRNELGWNGNTFLRDWISSLKFTENALVVVQAGIKQAREHAEKAMHLYMMERDIRALTEKESK